MLIGKAITWSHFSQLSGKNDPAGIRTQNHDFHGESFGVWANWSDSWRAYLPEVTLSTITSNRTCRQFSSLSRRKRNSQLNYKYVDVSFFLIRPYWLVEMAVLEHWQCKSRVLGSRHGLGKFSFNWKNWIHLISYQSVWMILK